MAWLLPLSNPECPQVPVLADSECPDRVRQGRIVKSALPPSEPRRMGYPEEWVLVVSKHGQIGSSNRAARASLEARPEHDARVQGRR